MDTRNLAGFDYRIVDFSLIHNHTKKDLDAFASIVDPQKGQVILDGMDGYGGASKEILALAQKRGFRPEFYTLDESGVQVERARKNLPHIDSEHIIRADIRHTPFTDNFFDTVVIKMGVHELPKSEQPDIFKEVYRVLKPNGKLVIWELSFLDEATQKVFQDIIRQKDTLAGFDKLVALRYFPTRKDLLNLFKDAGFQDVSVMHQLDARLSLRVRESELVSKERKILMDKKKYITSFEERQLFVLGKQRCGELVSFTKKYMANIPISVKKLLLYSETEDDIHLKPNKEILAGYKR